MAVVKSLPSRVAPGDDAEREKPLRRRIHLAMAAPFLLAVISAVVGVGDENVVDFGVSAAAGWCMAVGASAYVLLAIVRPGLGRYADAESAAQLAVARDPRKAASPVSAGLLAVLVPFVACLFLLRGFAERATVHDGLRRTEPARVETAVRRTGKGCHTQVGLRLASRPRLLQLCPSPERFDRTAVGDELVIEHRSGAWGDAIVRVSHPDGTPY